MKKLALVDFDNTLVMCDTLGHILKEEKYYLDVRLLSLGVGVLVSRILYRSRRDKQILFRSKFKEAFLSKFCRMTDEKLQMYVDYFKSKVNVKLLDYLDKIGYDKIMVVSGSEEMLIKRILDGILSVDAVVANSCADIGRDFMTCWNINKVVRLRKIIDLERFDCIHLYTDSYDDLPLMEIANETYMVRGEEVLKL